MLCARNYTNSYYIYEHNPTETDVIHLKSGYDHHKNVGMLIIQASMSTHFHMFNSTGSVAAIIKQVNYEFWIASILIIVSHSTQDVLNPDRKLFTSHQWKSVVLSKVLGWRKRRDMRRNKPPTVHQQHTCHKWQSEETVNTSNVNLRADVCDNEIPVRVWTNCYSFFAQVVSNRLAIVARQRRWQGNTNIPVTITLSQLYS